jgi:hypothetical protein
MALDSGLGACRHRLVRKQFTDECFWRTYATTVEALRLVRYHTPRQRAG